MSAAQRFPRPGQERPREDEPRAVLPFPSSAPAGFATPEARAAWLSSANLLDHPPRAKGGFLATPVRLLRKVAKAIVGPWFDFQTQYNRQLLDELAALHARLDELTTRLEQSFPETAVLGEGKDRINTLHARMHYAMAGLEELRAEVGTFNGEVSRLRERLDLGISTAVNRELGPGGRLAEAGLWFSPACRVGLPDDVPTLLAVTERILEHFFVPTRLPPPPARVLELGCACSTLAVELAGLGYEVTGVDRRALPLKHPSFRMVLAEFDQLPVSDGSTDAVVSLSTLARCDCGESEGTAVASARVLEEIRRVLRPGGLLLLTVPFGQPAATEAHRVFDRAGLNERLQAFRRVETLFGVRDGESWSLTADAVRAEQVDSSERVNALALVVARKD